MEAILAITLIFGIPITAILTSHMRRMKELEIQSRQYQQGDNARFDALEQQVRELRERLNDQTLVVEGMRDLVRRQAQPTSPPPIDGDLQQRLNS